VTGASRIAGIGAVVALAFSLCAAAASAERPKVVAKVGPRVYLSKITADAKSTQLRGSSAMADLVEEKRSSGPSKIVGGNTTLISEWPWQTATVFDESIMPPPDTDFDRQFCGGTLVAPNISVSAAHCAFDVGPGADGSDGDFDAIFFDVLSGRSVLSSSAGQKHTVANYFFFTTGGGTPLFTGDPDDGWDVIFIQLATNSSSQPIKVAGPGEGAVWAPGRTAFATGWGALSEGGAFPDQLREVQLGIISDATCDSPFINGISPGFDPATMVCAGVLAGGKDACEGDSGGPLVVPIAGGGFRLVGDTSFGLGCARPNKPGIYGRLAGDPVRSALATGVQTVAGVNILGSGAQPPPSSSPLPPPPPPPAGPSATCLEAQEKLAKAKKKFKKARKKAKESGTSEAKKKLKKAKRKRKRAKQAVEEAC
jgi:Trypsin